MVRDVAERAFAMVQRAGRGATEIVQACLKMLTTVLRHCPQLAVSDEHLRAVLQSGVFLDLEESGSRSTAFALLKVILARRLLVPELYDLMARVGELMIKSQALSVRHLSRDTFLTFLLDYPLGPKRLQQHLDFVVLNLTHQHASGREAALAFLQSVIAHFPSDVIEEQAEALFVALIPRLVSDSSGGVRSQVGATLKALLRRVGDRSRERLLHFALMWFRGQQRNLWRPAAQVKTTTA